jgi:hypothetical protein
MSRLSVEDIVAGHHYYSKNRRTGKPVLREVISIVTDPETGEVRVKYLTQAQEGRSQAPSKGECSMETFLTLVEYPLLPP